MKIESLVDEVQRLASEVKRRTGAPLPVQGPPASSGELEALEKKLGPLPPAYRELMQKAGGWSDFHPEPGARLFSPSEMLAAPYDAYVATVRGWRGWTKDPLMQKGQIVGGGSNAAFVLEREVNKVKNEQALRVAGYKPRSLGGGFSVAQFLEFAAQQWSYDLEDLDEADAGPPADGLERAAELYRYPNEMGEDVHDSVEALRALQQRWPARSSERKQLARLIRELSKAYGGGDLDYRDCRVRSGRLELAHARTGKWEPA